LAHVTWHGAQPPDGSILLESEPFEPLINFLVLLVQQLWPKNN